MTDETDETNDEWLARLTDKERRWVAIATDRLEGRCEDPVALIRADMASTEYALVARHIALHNHGRLLRRGNHCSLELLRFFAGTMPERHAASALALMDRMASAGLTGGEILDYTDFIMFMTETWVRYAIDDTWDQRIHLAIPQHVLMEMVNGRMSGRKVSGGRMFGAVGDQIDPWPGEEPGVRPWHSSHLD